MKKIVITCCMGLWVLGASAQPKKVLADKIIATIGEKIILQSDIEAAIHDLERQNIDVPPNASCVLLDQSLQMKALVVQAERDSIPVPSDEVDAEIDRRIRAFIAQYGSKEILEQVAGRTVFQLKEDMKPIFTDQLLARNEREQIVKDVRITPKEVTDYFESIPKDSLPFYESHLEVGQIVMYPKASRDLEQYAIEQLNEYKSEVEKGTKKFEVLASLYTDDPGSKQTGGMYEINRNEKSWDPIFLAKAFTLKDGQISNPFKGKFGYHIIQMVSRRGDDATIRHILKIPQVSSLEISETIQKLDSVRTLLVEGKITFGDAVQKYSEDDMGKFTAGRVTGGEDGRTTNLTIDEFDKDLVLMLKDLKVGQYSKPVEFLDQRGNKAVRIIDLISKTEPHRENLKDDYDQISNRALEIKKAEYLDRWFLSKLPSMFVTVDPAYSKCEEMEKWTPKATATSQQ